MPYAYALVELSEGPIIATNIVNCDESTLRIDMPVKIHYLDVNEEVTLPLFEPGA